MQDFSEAWKWIEYAKARAFLDELQVEHVPSKSTPAEYKLQKDQVFLPALDEPAVFIHWVFVGETIYMMTCRSKGDFRMFRLDITVSAVAAWYQGLVATREDFSDTESAEDLLSELAELCIQQHQAALRKEHYAD